MLGKQEEFIRRLKGTLGEQAVRLSEPMREHTTFRIGGPADYFLSPDSEEGILEAVRLCREGQVPLLVIGNGSNLLVGDGGFRGAVLQIYKNYAGIRWEEDAEGGCAAVQAGALLGAVAREAAARGLAGLEFAAGIPGSIGGAAAMNAGAYGGEMKDVLVSVRVLDGLGRVTELTASELDMGYRSSRIQREGLTVLEARIRFARGDRQEIVRRMRELAEARGSKQPLEYPSAGSTFKRPEGYFAGKLIMDAGLRGYRVGDAMVSEKHCGFVVNCGEATAAQVMGVVGHVQEEVYRKFGVRLEMEVKQVGQF